MLARVRGFFLRFLGRLLALLHLSIGLELDRSLHFLKDHRKTKHDAKGRQPSFFFLSTRMESDLLRFEGVLVDF